jgi:hypothetical protein
MHVLLYVSSAAVGVQLDRVSSEAPAAACTLICLPALVVSAQACMALNFVELQLTDHGAD